MNETKSLNNNKRIAKNTFVLYIRMLLIMLVTLYTSRVILKTLGEEDFGIYNIVGGIIILFSFLNGAMVVATQRFLSYEIGRGDEKSANKVFFYKFAYSCGVSSTFFSGNGNNWLLFVYAISKYTNRERLRLLNGFFIFLLCQLVLVF